MAEMTLAQMDVLKSYSNAPTALGASVRAALTELTRLRQQLAEEWQHSKDAVRGALVATQGERDRLEARIKELEAELGGHGEMLYAAREHPKGETFPEWQARTGRQSVLAVEPVKSTSVVGIAVLDTSETNQGPIHD